MSPSLRPVMGLRLDKVVAPDTHFSGSSDEPSPFVNISNFTAPSSRIFNRRDWQASSFTTLARLMISRTVSAFSRSALRIFSRSFSITRLLAITDDTNDGDDCAHPQRSRCYERRSNLKFFSSPCSGSQALRAVHEDKPRRTQSVDLRLV